MRSPSIVPPGRAGRVAGLAVALLPTLAGAAPTTSSAADPAPPAEVLPTEVLPAPPAEVPPAEVPPATAPPADPGSAANRGYVGPDAVSPPSDSDPPAKPKKKKKKKKKKKAKKKPPKPPQPEPKVNRGLDYQLGLYPGSYVQGADISVGAQASVRQTLEPRKGHRFFFDLGYEYEPFSTKTLGFPEEDETQSGLNRTLVQPIHIIEGQAARRIVWGKLVTTTLELHADAWWPSKEQHQRWALRVTPGIRIGKSTGPFGEAESQFFYKKFPNYLIADRHIDQEGAISTARVGYNFGKLARVAAGFTFDYTHYLNSRYNAIAPDGMYIRSTQSKNYLDYIPFAELQLRLGKSVRIRGRYAFERQRTQNYDRVMTGRDEFASLVPYFFRGYYDYRRHRASLGVAWDFRDRLRLTAAAEAWVRHFDVYEARDVDNFWTGELRLDTEIEASLAAAVRVHTLKGKHREHDFFVSLLGAHVSRRSNMTHEISLATNFDITRVLLGFEVRGH